MSKTLLTCQTCSWWKARPYPGIMGECTAFSANKPDTYIFDMALTIETENFDTTKVHTNKDFGCRSHSAEEE